MLQRLFCQAVLLIVAITLTSLVPRQHHFMSRFVLVAVAIIAFVSIFLVHKLRTVQPSYARAIHSASRQRQR